MKNNHFVQVLITGILIGLAVLFSGCEVLSQQSTEQPPETTLPTSTATVLVEAMVTFRVALPEPLQAGDSVYLTLLDEVSGLALNPTRHLMQAEDPQHFIVILPVELNNLLKYRYSREGTRYAEEHTSDGRMVRYRMLRVDGPGLVQDVVSSWTDTEFKGPSGRIKGYVHDRVTGDPLVNILVSAGGASTLTSSDGGFLLEGLPPGTHNLVAYAMDGAYQLYQQGAVVAADSTTPAPLFLTRSKMVKVELIVSVPGGTIPAVPVRLAGSLSQLGNTFGDLRGGVNLAPTRMPVLQPMPDGRYSITLDLPAGEDLRYKYTLGDGFWNAERNRDGSIRLRRLIVPDRDTIIEDTIATWSNGPMGPITFDIQVPGNTPMGEMVSIQLNPRFGWTEPIPMWPVGGNRWIYVLFSPLDSLNSISYRYCRNEQCGMADDIRTAGPGSTGFVVEPPEETLTVNDVVEQWTWLYEPLDPITVPDVIIEKRGPAFMAGIEFQEGYHPSWQAYLPAAMIDIASLHSNWVVVRPTWSYTRQNLPVLEALPGKDPLWTDLVAQNELASSLGLKVALFPAVHSRAPIQDWWQEANRNFAWWVVWFESYERFILHHANLAESQGVEALILGGEWLDPALPDGLLVDGSSSGVPQDADQRWQTLLEEVRSRFSGKLLWALSFPEGVQNPPAFIEEVDQVYVLWSVPLIAEEGGGETQMAVQARELMGSILFPFVEQVGKPVVLGLTYPTTSENVAEVESGEQDARAALMQQVQQYNAMLMAINGVDWVEGLVGRGYYPPAILQDISPSLHGKPARGVLWYWFERILVE